MVPGMLVRTSIYFHFMLTNLLKIEELMNITVTIEKQDDREFTLLKHGPWGDAQRSAPQWSGDSTCSAHAHRSHALLTSLGY